jgi:hypothetical protein
MEERKFETWQMIEAGKRDPAAGLRGSEVPFESWLSSVKVAYKVQMWLPRTGQLETLI